MVFGKKKVEEKKAEQEIKTETIDALSGKPQADEPQDKQESKVQMFANYDELKIMQVQILSRIEAILENIYKETQENTAQITELKVLVERQA